MDDTTESRASGAQFKQPLADALDTMMVVVRPKGWLALYCGLAILLIIIIWGFMGSIPIIVSGYAISLSTEGPYVIVSQTEGTVIDILVREGQEIQQGDTIVRIVHPVSQLTIAVQQQKIDIMEINLVELRKRIAQEDRDRKESIQKKINSEEHALANSESSLPYLQKDLEAKIRLNERGIISQPEVERARTEVMRVQNNIQQHRANIASFQAELATSYRASEIESAEIELFEVKKQLERMQLERTFLDIKSEKSGTLLEIVVSNGDRVSPGALVASLELPVADEEYLRFFAAIAGEYGVLLQKGLPVQIEVAGVDPKQYGYLLGTVEYISPYPVSHAEITASVANPQLAEFLRGGQPAVYALSIKLIPDESSPSGLKWTTRYGPPHDITTGTLATVRVVVKQRRPIFYIIPEEVGPYVQDILPQIE